MNFFNCRRLVTLVLSCGAVVIVTVNGQPTTDDDIGTEENYVELTARLARMEDRFATAVDETATLKDNLATAVDEIAKLKDNLATAVDKIAKLNDHVASVTANKTDDSKFNFFDT